MSEKPSLVIANLVKRALLKLDSMEVEIQRNDIHLREWHLGARHDVRSLLEAIAALLKSACPTCGGDLQPAFGQDVRDDGTIVPVLDPTMAMCHDCGELVPTGGERRT